MWTELFNWPEPVSVEVTQAGTLDDVRLRFGALDIGQGKAFSAENATTEVPIGKRFGKVGDRSFLVERVPYTQIKPLLDAIPDQAVKKARSKVQRMAGVQLHPSDAEMIAKLPPRVRPAAGAGPVMASIRRGAADRQPGVVLDYVTVASGSAYTFDGGTTYFVSGTVNLAGATFNGGCVIKMDSTASTMISLTGPATFNTSGYRPVIISPKTDNSVGDYVVASDTGNPLPRNYGTPALKLNYTGAPFYVHDIAIRRAAVAIRIEAGSLSLTNAQFVSCGTGIYKTATATTLGLRNVLADDVGVMFDASGTSGGANSGYHLTLHRIPVFMQGTFAPVSLVNSLLISVTNTSGYFTDPNSSVVVSLSDTGVFAAPVGAGNHYLAVASPYRACGAALSDAQLTAELGRRTTYPPVSASGTVSSSTPLILGPQVARDISTLDYGYHYAVIDCLANGLEPTGGITLTNGVVVGCAGTSGLRIYYSLPMVSEGTPTVLNRIVSYATVQEQPVSIGSTSGGRSLVQLPYGGTATPSCRLRYTDTSMMAAEGPVFNMGGSFYFIFSNFDAKDCQVHGGSWRMGPSTAGMQVTLANNLFEYCALTFEQNASMYGTQPFTLTARNNLFRQGSLSFSNCSGRFGGLRQERVAVEGAAEVFEDG